MTELLSKILTIKIESFGAIQRHLPEDLSLQSKAESNVEEILTQVIQTYPEAADLIERCACAMGEGMINRQTVISRDAVIVLLSPVAGG